jgi:hypothetical protein
MQATTFTRGDKLIGFTTGEAGDPTLPALSEAMSRDDILQLLLERTANLETLVQGKVDVDRIKSEIAISDEAIKIAASEIVLFGNVTLGAYVDDQRGEGDGSIDITLTRIIGDRIQTGSITSNNWGAAEGTAFDLDNETITLGGSSSPKFYYDGGGNLSLTGTIQANSVIDPTATVEGTDIGDIKDNAQAGYDIQQALEVTGSTVLKGTIEPENTGGFKSGTISWNSTTGALTGGNGIAITEYGILGADSGSATFTIQASNGSSTWAGDVVTAGQVRATGTVSGGANCSIFALPDSNGVIGIAANKDSLSTADAIQGVQGGSNKRAIYGTAYGSGAFGVYGQGTVSSATGVAAYNSAGGTALELVSDVITGDATFEDDVTIERTLTVDLGSTFNDDVVIQGNSTLDVDRSAHFATDEASGQSSIVLGNATATGQNTFIVNQGSAGSRRTDEFHIYGQHDSGQLKCTIGLVLDAGPESGTGSFVGLSQLPIYINSTRYKLPLEAY